MNSQLLDLLSIVGKIPLYGSTGFGDAARLALGQANQDIDLRHLRRDIEGLGHIRTVYGSERQVCVLSPRFCILPRSNREVCEAVLVGARTQRFVDELKFVCSTCKVKLEDLGLGPGLPFRIKLRGTYEALQQMAQIHTSRIDFGPDAEIPDAWRLVHSVPNIATVLQTVANDAENFHLVKSEQFVGEYICDPLSGKFRPWQKIEESYPSRLLLLRKTPYDFRIALRTERDEWRRFVKPVTFDPRWAIWGARVLCKPSPSIWTELQDRSLRIPAAFPLPTDLHQIACLCSGLTPLRTAEAFEYHDVPPIIQKAIRDRLTPQEM